MIENFKICPNCQQVWSMQIEFISDGEIELNGYKSDFEKLEYGMFFFTHKKVGCFSTMVLEVKEFLNLYEGPFYSEQKTGTEDCPNYCRDKEKLDRCEAFCECAFVREIINIIREKQTN
jgi:hypothetical protein